MAQSKLQLSIILPIYNVEPYLEKCIRSLENQDIPRDSYEVICVNDGSPDNCLQIIKDLQKDFSNIVLIDQQNQGVSVARNNGIKAAEGEYILPIDPDDYVIPNVLKFAYQNAKERTLDILHLGFEIFDENGQSIWHTNYQDKNDKVYNGVDGYFAARGSGVKDPDRSVAILFRKKLLKEHLIIYPKNVPFLEDGLFLGKVFSVSKRVGFLSKKFYQRTTRIGSATNSRLFYDEKALNGFLYAIEDINSFRNKFENKICDLTLLNHLHSKFFLHALAPSASEFGSKTFLDVSEKLESRNLVPRTNEGVSKIFKRFIWLYKKSKWLFYFSYPIYMKIKNLKRK